MKHLKLLLLMASALLMFSCEKPINNDPPQPYPEVSYRTIAGAWELVEWNGKALEEGTHLYIEFDKSQRFEMWDNLGSMYTQQRAGTYSISTNTKGEYILCGTYDNGVGDWNAEYVVSIDQEATEMVWRSEDETSIFCRIAEIPELD
jgi:putative hemolysin